MMVTRSKANTGVSLTTFDHIRDNGIARSLANAHVDLDAAVVIETEQNSATPSTKNMSARPPPGVPMTVLKIYGTACANGAARTSSKGGSVKHIGKMKKSPAMNEIGKHHVIAREMSTVGLATSSAMEVIIPIAAYV